jgi:hypothetical protein
MHSEGDELMAWVVWLVLFTIAITFQLVAVATNNHWGMLTSTVRWLRARMWGRLIVFPAWFWLTWHWFIEPQSLGGAQFIDDVIFIILGVVAALFINYQDYIKTKETTLDDELPEFDA